MTNVDLDFGYPNSADVMVDSPAYSEQNQPRQRLKSWLIDQLNHKTCPGCTWLDQKHGFFKLVWKHYGRPGYDEENVSINIFCCFMPCTYSSAIMLSDIMDQVSRRCLVPHYRLHRDLGPTILVFDNFEM